MPKIRPSLLVAVLVLNPWPAGLAAAPGGGFETMPIALNAADVLPADLIKGSNYTIAPAVSVDGFDYNYSLTTDHGAITTDSTALLMMRIVELEALDRMLELERTEVFGNALKTAGKAPFSFVKGMVTEPVDTVSDAVSGVGRFFKDLGRSIASDDPHQENALKTAVGFAAAKRKFAYEFGINPYSSYEPLQERLNEIAWAGAGGGLTVKVAFAQISDTTGTALRVTGTSQGMRQLVRDNSPAELQKINTAKLEVMGANEAEIQALMGNHSYDPQELTLLVGALNSMQVVGGRPVFIRLAGQARDVSEALYWRLQAEMMDAYYVRVARVTRLVQLGGQPFMQEKDGTLVGVFPVDYLAWTEGLSGAAAEVTRDAERVAKGSGRELWFKNSVTPAARAGLEASGWQVTEQAGKQLKLD